MLVDRGVSHTNKLDAETLKRVGETENIVRLSCGSLTPPADGVWRGLPPWNPFKEIGRSRVVAMSPVRL